MEGSMKLIKYLMFLFNFILLVLGLVSTTVGTWILLAPGSASFTHIIERYSFRMPAGILIAVGVIVMFIAFFGCCGAVRESSCLLMTFSLILGALLCIELGCVVVAFLYKNKVDAAIRVESRKVLRQKYGTGIADVDKAIDNMQQEFKCCGIDSSSDYEGSEWQKRNKLRATAVPKSCCRPNTCLMDTVYTSTYVFKDACITKIRNYAVNRSKIIGGIGIGVCLIQIIGILLSSCLYYTIRKEYEVA